MNNVVSIRDFQEQGAAAEASAAGAMERQGYYQILEEINDQPQWRPHADKCCDYYDDNQIDQETAAALKDRDQLLTNYNLIQPTIDVVLGLEAKMRTDWRVQADTDEHQDMAEALTLKLCEAERESRADRACSDAYAGQIKAGVAWIEVGRNANPFMYRHRVGAVHRREIFWDWSSKDPALTDCNYIVRRKFYEKEQLKVYMPKAKEAIEAAAGSWDDRLLIQTQIDTELADAFREANRFPMEEYEMYNLKHRRVCVYEVTYRTYVRGYVLRKPNGSVVEFDPKNMLHKIAIAQGLTRPEEAVFDRLRRAMWIGPYRVYDRPLKSRNLPYVPFWGYREDLTGIPYGLIRTMIAPQDEVNARGQKMLWLLAAKRLKVDSDALDIKHNTLQQVLDELSRADAAVVLNPDRKNGEGAFQIDENLQLSEQQFKVMQQNVQLLQQVRGIFNAMLGREGEAKSGIAINSLVEQGMTVLAEINDNFQFGRRTVGQQLLDQIREDIGEQPVRVVLRETGKKRVVILNEPVQDPQTGATSVRNQVKGTEVKVALEDLPSSPAYRAQNMTMLGEIMKAMPPNIQAVLAPYFFEVSELPQRQEIADAIRQVTGAASKDPQDMTPEEQAAAEAEQKQVMETKALSDMSIKLDLKKKAAEAAKIEAEVEKMRAETPDIAAQRDREAGESMVTDEMTAYNDAREQEVADLNARNEELQRAMEDVQRAAADKEREYEARRIEMENRARVEIEKIAAAREKAQRDNDTKLEIERARAEGRRQASEEKPAAKEEPQRVRGDDMTKIAQTLADAIIKQGEQMKGAVEEMGAAVADAMETVAREANKPRKIELEIDDEGNPVGARSSVEADEPDETEDD